MTAPKACLSGVVIAVGLTVGAGASELHVQCPAGTGAVIRGNTVVCESLPKPPVTSPRPAPVQTQTIVVAPPPLAPSTPHRTGLELSGLYGIPEICGLHTLEHEEKEAVAEAMHMAVSDCVAELGMRPSAEPTRWVVFRISAVSERVSEVTSPPEAWGQEMDACLLRHPPRLPRAARGRSFTAWYLMTSGKQRPTVGACSQ